MRTIFLLYIIEIYIGHFSILIVLTSKKENTKNVNEIKK